MEQDPTQKARWAIVRERFLDLADLGSEQREQELVELRREDPELAAEVQRLLEQDVSTGPSQESPAVQGEQVFGAYVAVRPIGFGGMGEVFLARRSDGAFEREVAVKLIRADIATPHIVERFLRERQTLAALEHEGIVRLLDGGKTEEGLPYLVMEYVDGITLDAYLRQHDLALEERLELFRQVLDAVAHAHEREIIHRDLKPSNILVRPDGSPRIVDFGIARSLDPLLGQDGTLTQTGHRLYTPRYASPEQVRGDKVSPRTDVFALGTILYELISGASPWGDNRSTHEIVREILNPFPARPSRLLRGTGRKGLPADLDTITLKCLHAEPERRYADAGELARDLDCFLEGRPIQARKVSTVARSLHYLKRRPWPVAAGFASVAAAAFVWNLWTSQAQAKLNEERSAAIPKRLEGVRGSIEGGDLQRAASELELIERDAEALPEDALTETNLHWNRALVLHRQRDFNGALEALEAAADSMPDAESPEVQRLRLELAYQRGNTLAALRRLPEGEASMRSALELAQSSNPIGLEFLVRAHSRLGRILVGMRRTEEAVSELTTARSHALHQGIDHNVALAGIEHTLARALGDLDRHHEAIPLYESALEGLRWHYGERDPRLAETFVFLAHSLTDLGRPEDSVPLLTKAKEVYADVGHRDRLALTLRSLGIAAHGAGDLDLALESLESCHEILTDEFPQWAGQRAELDHRLGQVLLDLGETESARTFVENALKAWPQNDPYFDTVAKCGARATYADVLEALGEDDAAEEERKLTIEALEGEGLPGTHPLVSHLRASLDPK